MTLQLVEICLTIALQIAFVKTGLVTHCVPELHQRRAAHRLARDMFYEYDLQATNHRNALLIFVSLQERMLILLPDKALRQKVPYQIWDELVQHTLQQRHLHNLPQWLVQTIRACGTTLKRYDPAENVNEDEISNAIRFI